MTVLKYITPRLIILVIFIFMANVIYKHTFWMSDIRLHGDILENMLDIDPHSKAVYFGESSNFHVTEQDSVRHRISYILDDLIPEMKISTVDNSGLHSGTYLAVIKNIPEKFSVKILIITMNYRSFDATWRYAEFENYLAKTERMLSPGLPVINKFLVSLKQYDYKTKEKRNEQMIEAWQNEKFNIPDFEYDNVISWDSAMAKHTWLNSNENLTEENIGLACHYIKNFAFDIDTLSNERIKDFDAIMKLANRKGYKVVFNLLAENMEEAQKLVGDQLIYLIDKNRKLLIDRYEKMGALVVDNMYAVPDSCFVDRNWPTEHYNISGKTIVATNIQKSMKSHGLLPD